MKLNKCFNETFGPTLKQAGFSKLGLLYYRMHGTLLQSVFLKSGSAFQIEFSSFPYWLFDDRCYGDFERNIRKGYWTQHGGSMFGFYYDSKNPEQNQQNMQYLLDIFSRTVLVYLDSMSTEEDAFLDKVKGGQELMRAYGLQEEMPGELFTIWAGELGKLQINLLLHQKYLGNLPLPIEEYVDKFYKRELAAELKYRQDVALVTELYQTAKEKTLSELDEMSKDEFLELYNAKRADMKQRLQQELKLVIDD